MVRAYWFHQALGKVVVLTWADVRMGYAEHLNVVPIWPLPCYHTGESPAASAHYCKSLVGTVEARGRQLFGAGRFFNRAELQVWKANPASPAVPTLQLLPTAWLLHGQHLMWTKPLQKSSLLEYHQSPPVSWAGWNGSTGQIWPADHNLTTPGLDHLIIFLLGLLCISLLRKPGVCVYWESNCTGLRGRGRNAAS